MKRLAFLSMVCLLLALGGCQETPTARNAAADQTTTSPIPAETVAPVITPSGQMKPTAPTPPPPAVLVLPPSEPPKTAVPSPPPGATPTPSKGPAPSPEPSQKETKVDVEIKEKMFLGQMNDIFLNVEDYLGKTIKYEGMFTQYNSETTGMTYNLVYRKSPGCCGADGIAGFEVIWPDEAGKEYPKENDWAEVTGILEKYKEGESYYLRLSLSSLTVLDTRGAEFVSQ